VKFQNDCAGFLTFPNSGHKAVKSNCKRARLMAAVHIS
jgi:hypothetical protein